MKTHIAIEQAHASGTPVAGFTLDIVKCFNCIPRLPTRMLLLRLGIPENLVRTWYGSLQRLTRVIDIEGNLSQPVTATTGLPEGCPVSVLGMATSIHKNQVQVLTFYGNWSWISPAIGLHQETLARTIQFCKLLRLEIDFKKSWTWGTTKEIRIEWTNILQRCLEDANAVPVVLQATDLGVVSHFAKTHGLLKSGERIESGIRRLGNLVHVKSTIEDLVQTVIWPHALFGAEFIPLGLEHFERLRTKLTEVLMRRPKSGASPWIACNVLVNELQDPEEYYHLQVLRNTRRYLCRAQTSEINAFKSALHEHEGRFAKSHGPVGVRKRTLHRLGWTTTQARDLYTDRLVRIGITTTPWPLIRKLMQKSWLKFATHKAAHRKETAGNLNFNRALTAGVVTKLPVEIQHTACLQIAGGYQSETPKSKVDPRPRWDMPLVWTDRALQAYPVPVREDERSI